MGMSASQMRFCMLTGRKSDIEYQGQQINQQRTTLATQSSVMNEQLLTLAVPTPPSTDDYVRTVYKFNMDGMECSLTGRVVYNSTNNATTGTKAGKWDVEYETSSSTDKGQKAGEFYFNKETIGTGADAKTIYKTSNGAVLTKMSDAHDNPNYSVYSANIDLIKKDCEKTGNNDDFYFYNTTQGIRFVSKADLEANTTAGHEKGVSTYFVNDSANMVETKNMANCTVEYNEKNRITKITDGDGNVYTTSIETLHDEDAYQDAYNQYEFDKYEYEQKMNEINAKLEVIQSQDKQLELKLSNLDTEQSAVSTEMDAVKKVLDKNVESTFKTFG